MNFVRQEGTTNTIGAHPGVLPLARGRTKATSYGFSWFGNEHIFHTRTSYMIKQALPYNYRSLKPR